MKRFTQFSIRHLIALTIVVALLMPLGIACYPKVVAFLTIPRTLDEPKSTEIHRPRDDIRHPFEEGISVLPEDP